MRNLLIAPTNPPECPWYNYYISTSRLPGPSIAANIAIPQVSLPVWYHDITTGTPRLNKCSRMFSRRINSGRLVLKAHVYSHWFISCVDFRLHDCSDPRNMFSLTWLASCMQRVEGLQAKYMSWYIIVRIIHFRICAEIWITLAPAATEYPGQLRQA